MQPDIEKRGLYPAGQSEHTKPYVGADMRPTEEPGVNPAPTPGQQALALTAVTIGIVLLGVQLWLLTVALELYLAGVEQSLWILVVVSGLIFLGGLLVWWLLKKQQRLRR